jgi:phage shock protein A
MILTELARALRKKQHRSIEQGEDPKAAIQKHAEAKRSGMVQFTPKAAATRAIAARVTSI